MNTSRSRLLALFAMIFTSASYVGASDWSQFLGSNRDGAAAGFNVPESWPSELKKHWSVEVGDGLASPALVDGRLYVFARQGDRERVICLDAKSGEAIWTEDGYESPTIEGPASYHVGPRSVPAVAEGKVVTLGLHGVLSCVNASDGELAWRKKEFAGEIPGFFTSSSPIIVDGLAIALIGHVVAYDLESGEEAWIWDQDGSSYGSPALIDVDGQKAVVMPTRAKLVVLNASDGNLLHEMTYSQGRNNTAAPIVDGQTLYVAGPGRGMTAYQFKSASGGLEVERLWENPENSVTFNNPILSNGVVYGVDRNNELFSISAASGETAWKAPVGAAVAAAGQGRPGGEGGPRGGGMRRQGGGEGQAQAGGPRGEGMRRPAGGGEQAQSGGQGGPRRQGGAGGGRGARGGRGGMGGAGPSGFGSIVVADSVLFTLTPSSELVVIKPSGDQGKELARYKVSESQTYAYPVIAGDQIFIKDQNSVTLYSVK